MIKHTRDLVTLGALSLTLAGCGHRPTEEQQRAGKTVAPVATAASEVRREFHETFGLPIQYSGQINSGLADPEMDPERLKKGLPELKKAAEALVKSIDEAQCQFER